MVNEGEPSPKRSLEELRAVHLKESAARHHVFSGDSNLTAEPKSKIARQNKPFISRQRATAIRERVDGVIATVKQSIGETPEKRYLTAVMGIALGAVVTEAAKVIVNARKPSRSPIILVFPSRR